MLGSISSVSTSVSPTLSIMRSIIEEQDEAAAEANAKDEDRQQPTVEVNAKPSKLQSQVLENYYFGDHMTVNAAMAKLMDGVVQDLTDKAAKRGEPIDLGRADGSEKSYQQIAARIQRTVNMDDLAADKTLMKKLETILGVKLTGMTAVDLVNAFADPEGKAAEKVRGVVSEALAGQAGSKVMQRLDDVTKGPRSVDEVEQDAQSKEVYDEVDNETKAEDQADIAMAKVFETLGEVVDRGMAAEEETAPTAPDTGSTPVEAGGEAGPAEADEAETGTPPTGGEDDQSELPDGYAEQWALSAAVAPGAGPTSIYL
ncbi:hypothetical protein DFR52_102221 [Hoeflea marina]|uniref:Uncharacterized protein n=1 Tax=Hoeflea marina TaxID=274592 RepID=A0A317PND2_9HYPH|nr:hypothetical protein [Hoeflea marina]PWW01558.1 hypothetical protein DFR52_102221 [Hoeflea marina]